MPTNKSMQLFSAVVSSICLMLVACTTTETQSFRVSGNSNVDSSYIATDADFSQYHQLLIDDMGIFFPKSVHMPEEELAHIRQIFRDAFLPELAEYDITQEPGPGMLRITASLIDLRDASYGEMPDMRRDMRDVAQPGALIFLMELKDSGSNKVLARAGDSVTAPRFTSTGDQDWTEVEAAAKHWAALFRVFLDKNLGN